MPPLFAAAGVGVAGAAAAGSAAAATAAASAAAAGTTAAIAGVASAGTFTAGTAAAASAATGFLASGAAFTGSAAASAGLFGTGVALADALAIGSAVVSAGGGLATAQAQKSAGKFNSAQLAEQARQEREAAGLRAQERRRLSREQISTQQALLAASGADTSAGQSLLLQTESAAEGDFQARSEQLTGDRRASSLTQRADLERRRGRSGARSAALGAGTSLLGGFKQANFF